MALDIAHKLNAKIADEPNMRAMMTRDSDFFVPLNVRVQKAQRIGADLFVSIHADAYRDRMAGAILNGIKRYFAANPPLAARETT